MLVYRRLAALSMIAAFLAACSTTGSRSVLPPQSGAMQALAPDAARGSVIRVNLVGTISKAQMSKGLFGQVIDGIIGKPRCNVKLYAIVSNTIGVKGEPANASAAFLVPQTGCAGPFPLVGYAHGTNVVKEQLVTKPSTSSPTGTAPDQNPVVIAAIFAAHGYATAATDYLGLGLSTYSYHPYLQAASEASAVIDSMRAARIVAAKFNVPLSGEVFLSGHSQGGQSAVATQRAIEALGTKEFKLIADGPSSGPYALTQTFEDSLRDPSQDAPILAAYILTGYNKTYQNVYAKASQVFKSPYAASIDTLLPVATYKDQNALSGKTLPLVLRNLLQPAFYKSFLDDPKSGPRQDTATNDLLGGWLPKAPVYLCGGHRDPEVEYKNSESAQAYWSARKVTVQLVDVDPFIPKSVPITDYHVLVALFCLPAAVNYFNGLK